MTPLDYGRSFLIGNGPYNEVRFWVESRTRIIDETNGTHEDYIQVGSCKSEDTFAERDLFIEDNYDFLPIFGPEYSVIFRRRAHLNSNYRSCVPSKDMWNGQKYHLVEADSWEELKTNEAIREATYAYHPIVTQTEIQHEETRLHAIIECPVKTLNTNRENNAYQVDTGPVAFPDLSQRHARHADGITLAFVAFNAPHFADFILEVPTPIRDSETGNETGMVYHYSRTVSVAAANRVYAVTG